MPSVSMQQIRQVMLCETDSSDSDSDQDDARPAAARRAPRGAGSRQQGQRARAAVQGGDGSRASQTEDRIDMRLLFLKRMHGGTLPAFDDRHPDPGCAFEAMFYRQTLDPVFVPKSHETLQLNMVHQYDPETPHIRRLLEEVRESHWKLTAPKGFASLKGIPELQQLLAYTAADVAHYAVDSQGLGQPGSFEGQFKHDHHTVMEATEGVDTHVLYGKDSMIGQLAPGLRLCLAAEVATGLLCDSQPLPPDTPQHGSALLLFLAAALKQAEQECLRYAKPHGIEWEPGSSAPKPLLELCLCLDPQAALQQLQQAAAGSNGSSSSQCAPGSNGSSSSSQFCPDAGPPRDYAQGNVLLAALEVSTLLMQGSSTSSSNASKLVPAGEESSSTISSAGWTLKFAGPALQPLVKKLVQQQQQRWEGAAVAAGAVQSLVQLIDDFCSQHVSSAAPSADQQGAAAAEPTAAAEPATALAAEPAAATAGSVHSCHAAAADDVAWQVSVLTGAAALTLLALPRDLSEPQQQQEQAAAALPGLCPVRAALLFSAIEGLYFGVRQTLWLGVSAAPCGCTCSTCAAAANLQQQQQQLDMSPERLQSDITSQILSVLQLGQGLRVSNTGAAGNISGSHSSSSGSQQQQQWRQGQEQLRRDLAFAQTAAATDDRAAAASLMHFALVNGFSEAQFKVLQQLYSLQQLTTWAVLCPQAWLSYLFLTYEQEQLSPVCLQQGAATTAAAAAAAGAGGVDAAEGASQGVAGEDGLEKHRAAWTKLQPVLAKRCLGALAADLQQRQAAAGGSTQHKQQQQQGSSSAAGGDSAAGGGASQQPASQSPSSHHADLIAELAAGPDTLQLLSDMTDALLTHQRFWVRVVRCLARIDSDFDDYEMLLLDCKKRDRDRLRAAEREEPFKPKKHLRWSDEELAEALELCGEALFRPINDRSGSGGSGSSSSSSSGREPAGSSEQTLPPGGCGLNKDWACPVCAVEQKAGAFIADLAASTGASSSSSSKASAGLYDSFPVSWSDPYLMRRLLWDLLGRVKPTSQAWFKQYFHMCPHRITVWGWHALVMSLARHLWAPPGPWGPQQQQQQMGLLLPRSVSSNRRPSHKAEENAAARRQYARWCNVGFAHQSSNGAAAAVLSLQVLLSLDPHGARVQPRPELLFYTPAGFHAAVAKTLMQAFRLPPSLLPAGQCCGSADNTAAGSSTDERSSSQQASNQQQEPAGDEPHYLQAWGDTLFPAWYMWWHVGLLAYHQQQQQQQPKQTQSAAAAAGSSAAFVSPPVSPATPQLPAVVGAPALSGAAGGKRGSSVGGSSVGGSSCEPVSMQELYNNPDARLFAVGYAARHISSGAQLHRLLSNPPVARALQTAHLWNIYQQPPEDGSCCGCGVLFRNLKGPVYYCHSCTINMCSTACNEQHGQACAIHPVTRLVSAHRWRVLDLLRPASQVPQQQQPSAEPAAAAAPISTSLPPAAANCALPSILQQWANEAQDPAVMFQVHSGAPLGGAVSRSERRAQAGAAAADGGGEKSDDDSDDIQELLEALQQHGVRTITYKRNRVVPRRPGGVLQGAAGPDRPGTPEQLCRWTARGGSGRSYGPAPHALRDAMLDVDDHI